MRDPQELPEKLREGNWQRPIAGLDRTTWDVAVVGAGPAGSTAALHLAGHGLRVLLLDRARFPRDKACGDGLIGDSLSALDRASLLGEVRGMGHTMNTASVFNPSHIEMEVPGEYVTLPRRVLDTVVAGKAVELGAAFYHGEVAGVQVSSNGSVGLAIKGCPRTVTAAVLVVATGASMRLARQLGLVTRSPASAAGIRCYVRSSFRIDRMIASCPRSEAPGYGWIFPMGDALYNVGRVVFFGYRRKGKQRSLRELYGQFTGEFPLARRLLAEGQVVTPLKGGVLRCGLKGTQMRGRGNVLAVGEAIGTTLPLTGEGIGKAMEAAEIAAEVIQEAFDAGDLSRLRDYPQRMENRLRRRYRAYEAAERWLSVGWLNDFFAWRMTRSRFLKGMMAAVIRGTHDPREMFSVKGALHSLWA